MENLILFNYSVNFFHRYPIMGVYVVSKGQDRPAGNIRQSISELSSAVGVSRRRNPPRGVFTNISCTISTEPIIRNRPHFFNYVSVSHYLRKEHGEIIGDRGQMAKMSWCYIGFQNSPKLLISE